MNDFGKLLIVAGSAILVTGLLLSFAGRLPWLGNLPGDIQLHRKGFSLYAPIGTMMVVSIVLTILLNIVGRLFR